MKSKNSAFFLLFGSLFLLLFCFANRNGPGLTNDSLLFLETADNLRQTGSFGPEYRFRPPLFPLILSAFPAQIAAPAASFLAGISLLFSLFYFLRFIDKLLIINWLKYFFGALFAFSVPWSEVGRFLWTEPIFLGLLSLHFYAFFEFKNQPAGKMLQILTAVLLPLQRYPGLFCVLIAAGISYLIFPKKTRFQTLLPAGISALTLFLWLIFSESWNDIPEILGRKSLAEKPAEMLRTAEILLLQTGKWFFPVGIFPRPVGALFSLVLGGGLWFSYRKKIPAEILFWGLFAGIYVLIFVFIGIEYADDAERYLSVIYGPILMVCAFFAQNLLRDAKPEFRFILKAALVFWVLYTAGRCLRLLFLYG